jgi:hypothetical protein
MRLVPIKETSLFPIIIIIIFNILVKKTGVIVIFITYLDGEWNYNLSINRTVNKLVNR